MIRPEHDLSLAVAEVVYAGAGDTLKLNGQDAGLRPFALFAEGDVADDCLEGVGADVIGVLVLVEALGPLNGFPNYLLIGVRPGCEVIAERIDPLAGRLLLIAFEKLHDTRKPQRRGRQPKIESDDAIQHRPE